MFIPYINSMIMFNQRVLELGKLSNDPNMDEMRQCILYNKIFRDNMNELYRNIKDPSEEETLSLNHKLYELSDKYIDKCIKELIDKKVLLNKDMNKFEILLTVQNKLAESIMNVSIINNLNEINNYSFKESFIYFISLGNGHSLINEIDMKSKIFVDKNNIPMIDSIIMYLDSMYDNWNGYNGTLALFVIKSQDGSCIRKFEIQQGSVLIDKFNEFTRILRGYPVICNNIYIDEIHKLLGGYTLNNDYNIDQINEEKSLSFDNMMQHDHLLEYPEDSFDQYLTLLHMAAHLNDVNSIYITLYRIGNNPSIYYILREAVRRGKKVRVNIEEFASDENINKFWIKEMMKVGIDVIQYHRGLHKVHCKITLIKFKDDRGIVQIGTGNYHTETTQHYTDLSLITSDKEIVRECDKLFNVLSKDKEVAFKSTKFLVSRHNARKHLETLIIKQSKLKENGYIEIKCNSLSDSRMIKLLNDASANGCKINLIVRGLCTWAPDRKYLNKNVTIKSIVWNKLEHSRLYCFGRINPEIYVGSLDLVDYKLDNRIEVLSLITDMTTLKQIMYYIKRYNERDDDTWYMMYNKDNQICYRKKHK